MANSKVNAIFKPIDHPAIIPISWNDDKVTAFTTTKGCSSYSAQATNSKPKSPYDYFNLGLHVGDNADSVNYNRQQIVAVLSQPAQKINIKVQWLNQVHGHHVAEITRHQPTAITADAVVTREKNIALAVMTADCLPILLSGKDQHNNIVIAAVHGGWRPLAQNILQQTITKMQCQPESIQAWLGPCIGKTAFEVGVEVKQAFAEISVEGSNLFIVSENGNKLFANLHGIATAQLTQLGVNQISALADCTYTMADTYYSHRRACHQKNPDPQVTGRMASVICLR